MPAPPDSDAVATAALPSASIALFGGWAEWRLHVGGALLLLSLLFGVVGSQIHVLSSFAYHIGRRTFDNSWRWWYVIRPLVGGLLGVGVYALARAGLVATTASLDGANVFGFAAIAVVVGLFSERATRRLAAVADALFDSAAEEARGAILSRVEPATLAVGTDTIRIVLHGERLATVEAVQVGDERIEDVEATPVSVSFTLPDTQRQTAGDYQITAILEDGSSTNVKTLRVG
ncbi:MAG: hypothetical protein H0T94_00775 [Acidimicrobiia bacterium]|nr:hypothetical protein [Acidimicrobiia bacterium]